jgi:hypothetical protein
MTREGSNAPEMFGDTPNKTLDVRSPMVGND